jgi:hypothetical protein
VGLIQIEKMLDQAGREFLLDGRTQYVFPIRHTEDIRSRSGDLEREIKRIGYVSIAEYRDIKEGFVRVGRPSAITFGVEALLEKRPKLRAIRKYWDDALASASDDIALKRFLNERYTFAVKKADVLPACVRILQFLRKNRATIEGLFPRQLPHAESSKLIFGESLLLDLYAHVRALEEGEFPDFDRTWDGFLRYFGLVRKPYLFQFFAPVVSIGQAKVTDFHGLVSEETAERLSFERCPLLIVENEETFFALMKARLGLNVLRGAGAAVARASFLKRLFKGPVYYWGDIDKDGYEIFALVAEMFDGALPLLMGADAIERYSGLIQTVTEQEPGSKLIPAGLQGVYEQVCRRGIRIEQEKIPIEDILSLSGIAKR